MVVGLIKVVLPTGVVLTGWVLDAATVVVTLDVTAPVDVNACGT